MIILDIEATGTHPYRHSILSIGAIDFENTKRRFYEECRIWEGAHVMDEALLVNGFARESLANPSKNSEGDIVKNFFAWLKESRDHTIAGQNPSFDIDFLKAASERNHIDFPLAHRSFDLHSMVYLHMVQYGITPPMEKGRSALNSDSIMAYVGIPVEPHPHNALNGALYEAEAFSRILYGKSLLKEFSQYQVFRVNKK
ncbi:MAG: 3'-5' exonuclease [Patescibacteria group bacterium]